MTRLEGSGMQRRAWTALARIEHAVRRADAEDVDALVEVLARAFDDDPVPVWLFRGERRRHKGLRRFFGIQLRRMSLAGGQVWTTDDRAGAAIWAPPGQGRSGWRDLVRLLPVLPCLAGLGRDAPEAVRLLSAVESARPKQKHWYLATLGTDPDRQRTGVGSALVRTVLDGVDREGLPAYLESSKHSNLAFYGRHGFEVTGEIHTPRGGPTLWLMWRKPRPPTV
jgi:ribosomal protein S18 acetylase RimI-like enzyme